jgi:hypothetical protein
LVTAIGASGEGRNNKCWLTNVAHGVPVKLCLLLLPLLLLLFILLVLVLPLFHLLFLIFHILICVI